MTLETDYLVVGAGALGMAFVDALLDRTDAHVVMVDRRPGPGGHWLDAYPFVRLHQPSRFYGVDSTPLGHDRITATGGEAGYFERASGAEICGYYDTLMRDRFLASDRVEFHPMSDHLGGGRIHSRASGHVTEVTVRGAVVDATYMASRVPATEPPPWVVADGVRCVPVGALASVSEPPAGYVIVGGGKTALDAICWLSDCGVDPDAITWIRPRDTWVLNRDYFQPGRARTLAGSVLQLEATAAAASVHEVYERMEADGVVVRTDPSVVPTMMKGATVSLAEVEQLRRVERVVRMGRVERIEPDRIVLRDGTVPTTPDHLHVHCAASGLSDNPPVPMFADGAITLQLVTRLGLTLSGALLGVLEASGRTAVEKNALCPPNSMPHTPFDYLRTIMVGIATEGGWRDAPDLQQWLDGSRLNLLSGVGTAPGEAEATGELLGRLLAAVGPAFTRYAEFAAAATPQEQARIFHP